MVASQKSRKDLEFQLRTLGHHGSAAFRGVRPHILRVRSALNLNSAGQFPCV